MLYYQEILSYIEREMSRSFDETERDIYSRLKKELSYLRYTPDDLVHDHTYVEHESIWSETVFYMKWSDMKDFFEKERGCYDVYDKSRRKIAYIRVDDYYISVYETYHHPGAGYEHDYSFRIHRNNCEIMPVRKTDGSSEYLHALILANECYGRPVFTVKPYEELIEATIHTNQKRMDEFVPENG